MDCFVTAFLATTVYFLLSLRAKRSNPSEHRPCERSEAINPNIVFASEAKQPNKSIKNGLLRHCVPRNDGLFIVVFASEAKQPIYSLSKNFLI